MNGLRPSGFWEGTRHKINVFAADGPYRPRAPQTVGVLGSAPANLNPIPQSLVVGVGVRPGVGSVWTEV